MRDIKFRLYDSNLNKMFYDVTNINNSNLMQYTGMKDKKGNEIYEGDLIITNSGNYYTVKWNLEFVVGYIPLRNIYKYVKVMGNEYEN